MDTHIRRDLYGSARRFGTLKGWTLAEAAVLFGTANLAFAFADALGAVYERAGTLVQSGEFDRLLLRPRATWR